MTPVTPLSLDRGTDLCRLLADPSRLRLLMVLEAEKLSASELSEITGLGRLSNTIRKADSDFSLLKLKK